MGLGDYKKKRRFNRTPEPKGRVAHSKSRNLYVIQKHAASRLHYDVRLELDGTLKSWAVPKGPSLDPAQKRLAVHVEDHPIEYGSFEGVIPEGEYGGGTVMLWDRGTWKPREDAKDTYEKGRLKFHLDGKRLQGSWTLVKMKGRGDETADNWLMIKEHDEHATASPAADPTTHFTTSVATGRSMEDIASQRKKVWSSNREPNKTSGTQASTSTRSAKKPKTIAISPGSLPKAHKTRLPSSFTPQLATLVSQTPEGDDWCHEIKFDGYRLLCFLQNGRVRLETRSGLDWTGKFSTLSGAASTLPLKTAILDGEVMVMRPDGRSDFQALQNLLDGEQGGRLIYQLFDIPYCEGYDLTKTPLIERKQLLKEILSGQDPSSPLRYTEHIHGQGPEVFQNACGLAVEGLISKQVKSPYVQKRSSYWVKSKCIKRQEFVIGGYTDPSGSRKAFGALLLGYYDKGQKLHYAGRVGTGFTQARLHELAQLLQPREVRRISFDSFPSTESRRGIHWVRPDLVAEVEFTDWTSDGILRHPSFQGLREDKPAKEVVRERPVPVGTATERATPSPAPQKTTRRHRTSSIQLSNPQKILYPELRITKEQVAEYYVAVADSILPHISKRPLALVRCPEGHQQGCFFQKHVTDGMPDSIHGVRTKEGDTITTTIYIQDLDGLIGLAQLGVLEIHPWGTRIEHLDTPDRIVFDLDPAPDVKWPQVADAARVMRELLQHLGLKSFLKTTGGKGLHVVVPIEPTLPWDDVKAFTKAIAGGLARHAPARYIDVMTKSKRGGKIFVDYLRNGYGATSVATYSTRARVGAGVSTPIRWEEAADVTPETFTLLTVPGRVKRLKKDPWQGFFAVRQSITPEMRRQAAKLGQ